MGLEEKEINMLEGYVEGHYCYILNKKIYSKRKLTEGDIRGLEIITNTLKKFPVFGGRTYRNLQFTSEKEYYAFLEEYAAGKSVTLKALTSTSKLPNGYPCIGGGVVHLVIDGSTGRDIADTFGMPRQQEVIYLPGTKLRIVEVKTANDGNPLIFAQEVTEDGNISGKAGTGFED